jgi:hypothetical protein
MYAFAAGYIAKVRLTTPALVTPTPTGEVTTVTTMATKTPTPKQTGSIPTPYPTDTPQSPLPGILAITALGAVCVWGVLGKIKKN